MVNNSPHESEPQHYNEIYRFFEFSLDLFGISGSDGFLRRVNSAWERTLGYTIGELLSKPIIEFIHPEDRTASKGLRQQTSVGTPVINFENRYLCKDGSIKWLEWTAHPFPEDGLIYMVGRDITERKQAQDMLQQREQMLRQLLNATNDSAFLMDANGRVIVYNQVFVKTWGKTDQELADLVAYDLLPADKASGRRAYADEVFQSGKPVTFQDERAGRYVEISMYPIFDSDGRVIYLAVFSHNITHLKQLEDNLRQSEKTLREYVNALPGETVVTDLEGDLVTFNQAFAKRYSKPDVDLEAQNIYSLLSPLNAERRKPYTQAVIESGKPVRFQSESREHFFDVTIFPIFDPQQRVTRLGSFVQDVTDFKQAEEALRQSERTLRELLNGSQDMAYLVDVEGKLIAFNKKFAELLGVLDDGYSLNIYDILPSDMATMGQSIVNRVLSTRQPVREEIEYSGQFFEYSVHPILNEAHEVISLATFSHDITHRKITEHKLRDSEARFRRVLESAAEGILLTDSTGAILLVNQRIEQQFGYTREELFGQSVDILLPDMQRDAHIHQRQQYNLEPAIRPMGIGLEVFGQRKDGSTFPIEVSLSYIHNDGELQVMALVSDITERRQIEQARLNQERMQLELQQEREILELRQRFMSMVSHEFRTPLTVIASSCELLENYYDRLPKERQIEKLQIINGQVRAMVGLLDDILQLGKIQAGAVDFVPEILDLAALCNRVLSTIQIVDQQHHQLQLQLSDFVPPIKADRRMLEHAVGNLLSNAVKYSPPGSQIAFSLSGNGEQVRMEIRDEGMGIPLEDQPHLFEPFYRAQNARQIEGTGLGLAIVKHNIEKHGGTISCQSIEGAGTTFTIDLPAAATV